ncbi:phosphatidylethanolamine N-methyltransferas-like protein [Dothidotthia symphoricarpi CBS 119687]|uniref:Phosphatidylethanolamine N-methyltransferase n=1 Tax=Dothidotthia symphoricarpi CBS 119687 TaxID=1392245 RepID=A0A6A6AGW3_9PLEO|nr:phosphatidylethanolamine N-methyltransferas-like protein [Dothidotthia symphoricarpi CBS 119687]KAF2129681.1 phosphatidylethanolamine N-methyltransferas-like protein [Dothidotthia symphoricarpi CBS 119687]
MADVDSSTEADGSRLRERSSARQDPSHNSDNAKQKVLELNNQEDTSQNEGKEKRTYGRTPDGTVFVVPHTHDMVSQLLSPSQPKNLSDAAVLAVLAGLIFTLYVLPKSARVPVFACIFLFWRAAYNAGIGWMLDAQSKHNSLVLWARHSRIFEKPEMGKNPHPTLYNLLKREMETKIPKDYKFEDAPVEYNTWLVFRRAVDLILMCDFVSYCLFAIACFNRPQESWLVMVLRWTTGIILFLFNLWVKLDAHRVVKDYAWYWGDFFYLIDQNLTFDGVFEMAPHPMYSVGYAGYYGIALMMASYKVLFISIIAHAAQFAFLILVENPHIDSIYNVPPPRRTRHNSGNLDEQERPRQDHSQSEVDFASRGSSFDAVRQPAPMHHIVGAKNTDFHRLIDISTVLLSFYMLCLATLTPNTHLVRTLIFINAFVWRLWYALGLGYILDRQSKTKNWTRHFIKYGESKEEAWRQWKYLYHLSTIMCHASFAAAAWKMYTLPADWFYGLTLLRHVLGVSMIALQLWTAISSYESLGEFGWFCGDFFYDPPSRSLSYSGIYRFLNNPERVLGLAGIYGVALITWSIPIFFLVATAHILSLAFLQFIEIPHTKALYGRNLRQVSGVSKTVRQALPSPVLKWQSAADGYFNSTVEFIDDLLDHARPKFAAGVDTFVKDTTALFKSYPARISITRLSPDLAGLDSSQFKLEVEGTLSPPTAERQKNGGREGEMARAPATRTNEFRTLILEYGAPIKVRWQAPLNHSKKDWIGLYMVTDNQSREVTGISSNGRWVATNPGVYDSTRAEDGILVSDKLLPASPGMDEEADCYTGEIEFHGDKLWWTTGVFEFRYHHGGKHNVMALSQAFEIRIPRFDEDDVEVDSNGTIHRAVEQALLPIIQNCFDRDPEIAPSTAEESFGSLVERDGKFARRVVFAVHQMFGIEFAPEVVQADGTVRNLAWRICNAKKVLAPYSMSQSHGRNTPVMG